MEKNILSKFIKIKIFIFDVDGVMTDSSMLVTESGELLRTMNVRDGYAIKRAIEVGSKVYVITGGSSKGVEIRLKNLGVHHVFSGVKNKIEKFKEIMDVVEADIGEVLYMGDDLVDLEVMETVGLACAPQDAAPEIIRVADYISAVKGGQGAVRDVIHKVLSLQNKW